MEHPKEVKAPFPWFGGKSRVARLVWERFGDVATYNEPFAGSLAVLLGRPGEPRVETVNDLDCYLANFWRALQADPDGVAKYADSPVNEADLHARHRWLVEVARKNAERCMREPDFYDVKIAGWWVWGQCLWIGSGWCQGFEATKSRAGNGVEQARRPQLTGDQGVIIPNKRPAKSGNGHSPVVHRRWQGGGQAGGSGVHAPTLTRQLPQLSGDHSGAQRGLLREGVMKQQKPQLTCNEDGSSRGSRLIALPSEGLYEYLRTLAARLRRVRVCCGDWKRVLTPSVTTSIGTAGVFLDPPYSHDLRERCYSEDHDISHEVRDWAVSNGDNPDMRIALCGYEGEHKMPDTWECVPWKAHGGYSRSERGKANRTRERIWFSPHCLQTAQNELFTHERL